MKPSKPFVMPPVRIIPPTLEGQSESSKSLEEWLNTEETVRDLHFGKRTEEHMEYSYKSITNCTFSHIQFSACKLKSCHFTDVRFEHCDLSNISFAESSLFRVEFISCKLVGTPSFKARFKRRLSRRYLFGVCKGCGASVRAGVCAERTGTIHEDALGGTQSVILIHNHNCHYLSL